ncbi:MAG: MraY family glycosyltransferase [Gemmatimonadales bacterium]
MNPPLLPMLGAGVATGALATWSARFLARRLGIVSHPNPIVPQHTGTIAYLGGMAVAAGAVGALALGGAPSRALIGGRLDLIVGASLFLALGVVDDLRPLRPLSKFLAQACFAAVAVRLRLDPGADALHLLWYALSVGWILTVVNAVNLTDVCDGLVAGLAIIQLAVLSFLVPADGPWALAMAAACMGFLLFNAPPATIFLGDAGSHLLGFCLAILTLDLVGNDHRFPSVAQAILVAGVPLFELIFLVAVRARKGLPWWRGSPDHFSLRLQAAGYTRWEADFLAWAVMLLLAAVALGVGDGGRWMIVAVGGAVGTLGIWCWRYLGRHEVPGPLA